MIIYLFYTLNLLLLLSCLFAFRLKTGERRFSLSLVQSLLGLLLLAGEYIYLAYHPEPSVVTAVIFSESVFALIWFNMAQRLRRATVAITTESRLSSYIEISIGMLVVGFVCYCLAYQPVVQMADDILIFDLYGPVYFYSIFILIAMLFAAWRLEEFWRALTLAYRWEYKFLIVGSFLICGTLCWTTSYRLTYLRLVPDHLFLLAALLLLAWSLMFYAVARHRLLNRKIFVSRKVVYSFVTPSLFAVYLFVLGIISLVMRTFGLPLPFVLRWLFLALGLVALGIFTCSGKLRRRVHFFISTHFYVNKYEYRDEWLALSHQIQGALTEADVIKALRQVLADSLYTTNLIIWLGDTENGYIPIFSPGNPNGKADKNIIPPDDPLVRFLKTHPYFHLEDREPDKAWKEIVEKKKVFLDNLNLVLLTPLFIGDQLVGLIGIGPEFTGGRYGQDDFDLLTALGTQAASALLAVRMAEKFAHTREQEAWDRLSAFVLHDVKNAATMLSLVRDNAPNHIHDLEFQQDMLKAIDDALKRMAKVQDRLRTFKGENTPIWEELDLCRFLKDCCQQLGKKLGTLKIGLDCHGKIQVHTDQEFLFSIIENLLLNVLEAGGDGMEVQIRTNKGDDHEQAIIEIIDNGPGIPEKLLPDALFEPFKTSKPKGSGIGLWQARRLVASLKGTISAENVAGGGARFVVRLPLSTSVGKFNSK
ncbi:MAG: PEP-CTERM system histidine kinase PrsK [Deltaproteobacteria bacterium]|nr:PEP-CTERM system histidine kinase PrsK [Deltaproteobacteria bacterium]MBW1937680.1 PEP-CTERM system histidine kinase PrsK [Deltaproteobacteria bacterium]